MKSKLIVRLLLIVLFTVGCLFGAPRHSPNPAIINTTSTISDLAWISGAWQSAPGGRAQIEEYWLPPSGSSMLGMSRTVVGDKTVEFEYLRIEQRADEIYFVASPGGRCPATDFKLTRVSNQEAIFENPQHDFPKRIIYRKSSDGSLTATIDAGEGTKSKSFPYIRASK